MTKRWKGRQRGKDCQQCCAIWRKKIKNEPLDLEIGIIGALGESQVSRVVGIEDKRERVEKLLDGGKGCLLLGEGRRNRICRSEVTGCQGWGIQAHL